MRFYANLFLIIAALIVAGRLLATGDWKKWKKMLPSMPSFSVPWASYNPFRSGTPEAVLLIFAGAAALVLFRMYFPAASLWRWPTALAIGFGILALSLILLPAEWKKRWARRALVCILMVGLAFNAYQFFFGGDTPIAHTVEVANQAQLNRHISALEEEASQLHQAAKVRDLTDEESARLKAIPAEERAEQKKFAPYPWESVDTQAREWFASPFTGMVLVCSALGAVIIILLLIASYVPLLKPVAILLALAVLAIAVGIANSTNPETASATPLAVEKGITTRAYPPYDPPNATEFEQTIIAGHEGEFIPYRFHVDADREYTLRTGEGRHFELVPPKNWKGICFITQRDKDGGIAINERGAQIENLKALKMNTTWAEWTIIRCPYAMNWTLAVLK